MNHKKENDFLYLCTYTFDDWAKNNISELLAIRFHNNRKPYPYLIWLELPLIWKYPEHFLQAIEYSGQFGYVVFKLLVEFFMPYPR